MVEQNDTLGDPEWVVVRNADDAGAELDMPRAFGRDGDHDLRRSGDFGTRRMVLPKPRLVIAAAVQPLYQFQIALERERGVDAGLVEWGEKRAEAQPLGTQSHWTILPA